MSRRSIVVTVVLCALTVALGATAWFGPRTTPAELHALLREETPIGSTTQRVAAFLDSARVEHSAYRTRERAVYAIWRGTTVGLVSHSSLEVRFFFDGENRLSRYEVEEVVTSQ
jgi:hypothetical protein